MEILRKHLHNNSCRACLGPGCTYLVVTGYFPLISTGRQDCEVVLLKVRVCAPAAGAFTSSFAG